MSNENGTLLVNFFEDNSGVRGEDANETGVAYIDRWYQGPVPLPGQQVVCDVAGRLEDKAVCFVRPFAAERKRLNPEQKRFYDCARKESVTVLSRENVTAVVTLGGFNRLDVFLSGRAVGQLDRRADRSAIDCGLLKGIKLKLSNGTEVSAYEHHLQVITDWPQESRFPRKSVVLKSFVEIPVGCRTRVLEFNELEALEPGAEVGFEIPFQRFEGWLTNGEVWLPQKRPRGSREWKSVPFEPMTEKQWLFLVDVLEGKVLDDMVAYYKGELETRKQMREGYTRRQREVKEVFDHALSEGEIWSAGEATTVSLGRYVIFHVSFPGAATMYVVDNPGIGAIYVYRDYACALELAEGRFSREKAIREKHLRVIHRGQWRQRLLDVLRKESRCA